MAPDEPASRTVDVEAFYAAHRPAPAEPQDILVLSVDGKGVVMRPDALHFVVVGQPVETPVQAGGRLVVAGEHQGIRRQRPEPRDVVEIEP